MTIASKRWATVETNDYDDTAAMIVPGGILIRHRTWDFDGTTFHAYTSFIPCSLRIAYKFIDGDPAYDWSEREHKEEFAE